MDAARAWGHEALLVQLEGQDLVAIELRYHPSCHKRYIKILDTKDTQAEDGTENIYKKSFDVFAQKIIEGRIINGNEVLRMKSLTDIFINTVLKFENIDIAGYRNCNLKKRIKKRYPQVKFVKPSRRNESELVFCDDSEYRHLQNLVPDDSETESSCSADSADESYAKANQTFTDNDSELNNLYHAAQILKTY